MLLVVVAIAVLAGCAAFVVVMAAEGLVLFTALLVFVALVSLAVGWYVVRQVRAAQRMRGPSFAISL